MAQGIKITCSFEMTGNIWGNQGSWGLGADSFRVSFEGQAGVSAILPIASLVSSYLEIVQADMSTTPILRVVLLYDAALLMDLSDWALNQSTLATAAINSQSTLEPAWDTLVLDTIRIENWSDETAPVPP